MKFLKFILFFLLISSTVIAQKKSDFEKWYNSVAQEFNGYDAGKLNSKDRDKVKFNLLSDKYFIPIFEAPFNELSIAERRKIYSKIDRIYKSAMPLKTEDWWIATLHGMMSGTFYTEPTVVNTIVSGSTPKRKEPYKHYNLAIEEVENFRSLRSEYNGIMQEILSGNIDYNQLIQIKNSIASKYKNLLPSEIQYLEKITKEEQPNAANRSLHSKLFEIERFTNSSTSLRDLEMLKNKNYDLYKQASSENQSFFDKALENKREIIVNYLVTEEINKLHQLNFANMDINSVNTLWDQLYSSFGRYESFKITNELFSLYKAKKTNYVSERSNSIIKEVGEIYRPEKLDKLLAQYVTNTNKSPKIDQIDRLITSRKEKIEKFYREKEEENNRKEFAREELIKKNKEIVIQKRSELRTKYESNLPTFEELHFILQSYINLINPSGLYSVRDAEDFIRQVERIGYMRKRTGNISGDDETFENSKGFQIKCNAFASFDSEHLTHVEFKIPNPSEDLFELYAMELTSEYRNILRTNKSPSEIPDEDDFYVNSGRTLYDLKIDENGTLVVSARRNNEATCPIITERINYNTLKVSSFSNFTDIVLEKGQVISFKATGTIRVGILSTSPSGIDGWRSYNVEPNFRHGILMGKIGEDGNWFLIGSQRTITAQDSGILYLRINEKDVSNNEGYFIVNYYFD